MENIIMSIDSIRSNKMRALLTMLGVIIGISSVIGILTIGDSLSSSISGEFGNLGATNITVYVEQRSEQEEYNQMGYYSTSNIPEASLITDDMITVLEEELGGSIDSIALSESAGAVSFVDGTTASATGVTPAQFVTSMISTDIISGRNFSDYDIEEATNTVILSESLLETLVENHVTNGLGDDLVMTINGTMYVFDIIGIYDDSDYESTTIYIPIYTAKNMIGSSTGYSNITVVANADANIEVCADEIEELFERYYINNEQYKISTVTMQSMLDSLESMMATVSLALSAIAGISLLVGGIGVMNIMLVTVTERTKEIGTRKALGATGRQIQIQFVTEGAIICGIGGMIGIGIGAGFGYIGSTLMGVATLPSVKNICIATGIALAIGIFFSYSPAKKAARLNPIDALRYE
ncbi:MAG: ABC transporter permease [Eubacteriales bacterium]